MKKIASLWVIAGWVAASAAAQGTPPWRPAPGPLMTPWAKDVSPDRVWPEYPRPQMVRKDWINLNGLWKYALRPKGDERPAQWDGDIMVPFPVESALSGVMKPVTPDQRLWVHRTFQVPGLPDGHRLLLHFGAVDWQCKVWVNARQVGEHTGGYDPFTLDITDALSAGENDLELAVWDPTDAGSQPCGKQALRPAGIRYTAVTGIWQTAWLEIVPGDYIESLSIVPDVDRGVVTITVRSLADGEVRLTAKEGSHAVAQASGPSRRPIEMKIPNVSLWSPDSPRLYDLEVTLLRNGQTLDAVTSYFGMRKIEVRKDAQGINRLMLNGKVLFQYGALDQGWWPDGLYTPATDEAIKYDLVMAKRFGMNMVRKHVKVEPGRWYAWCDRLGLLVWQDMPTGDSARDDESKANFRTELQAMIDTLHNFPCVVMWIPFNEGWGQYDTREIVKWMEAYDPTRPVNEASGGQDKGTGAIVDVHASPGPAMPPIEDRRASVLGQFGGLGMPVAGHTWQTEKNWGYISFNTAEDLTDAYVGLLTETRPLIDRGLCAAVYTQTSDVEVEVNGLMTYDRALVKMDLDRIAAAGRRLHLGPPTTRVLVPTSQIQPQTWRYTTQQPGNDWFRPEFDDASWKAGPGGFGTPGVAGAVVNTVWNTPDIWLRRSFTLDATALKGEIVLSVHHDDDADLYLNGQLVRQLRGSVDSYGPVALGSKALASLKAGRNTLAVHCRQVTEGQYIDVGLAALVEGR